MNEHVIGRLKFTFGLLLEPILQQDVVVKWQVSEEASQVFEARLRLEDQVHVGAEEGEVVTVMLFLSILGLLSIWLLS